MIRISVIYMKKEKERQTGVQKKKGKMTERKNKVEFVLPQPCHVFLNIVSLNENSLLDFDKFFTESEETIHARTNVNKHTHH